jgi:hypothetical protein
LPSCLIGRVNLSHYPSGDFLDFWDAFLWLVAFIFIEMNIFTWHSEVEEEKAHGHSLQPG